LGVLEYVYDIASVFDSMSAICRVVIFSYCSTDVQKDRWGLWVNKHSSSDILNICSRANFTMEQALAYKPGQYIFRVVNRNLIEDEPRITARAAIGKKSRH